jgi:hypothetical protein
LATVHSKRTGEPPPKRSDARSATGLPARRRLLPITIVIAALIAIVSFATMFLVIGGIWPLAEPYVREPRATEVAIRVQGLVAEKGGEPRREGDQTIIPVKITNNYNASIAPEGTPTPGVPTAEPTNAYVEYAAVRVVFYGDQVGSDAPPILGQAWGQVLNLPYGESRTIDVVGTGIPERYAEWEPEIYSVTPRAPSR